VKEVSCPVEKPILQTVNYSNPCECCTSGGQLGLIGEGCGAYTYISKGDICKTFNKGRKEGQLVTCSHFYFNME
jgi:hypothetical protein